MKAIWLVLFAMAAGFTLSGIVASLVRIVGIGERGENDKILRAVLMVVAGPSVFFETAVRGLIRKEWTALFFWLVAAGLGYWSMVLGLLVLDIAIKF